MADLGSMQKVGLAFAIYNELYNEIFVSVWGTKQLRQYHRAHFVDVTTNCVRGKLLAM